MIKTARQIVFVCIVMLASITGIFAQNTISYTGAAPALLPPFPTVPAKLPIDSVTMGDWKSFPEMILEMPFDISVVFRIE